MQIHDLEIVTKHVDAAGGDDHGLWQRWTRVTPAAGGDAKEAQDESTTARGSDRGSAGV